MEKLNAIQLLEQLKPEDIAKEIEAARKAVDEATARLRSWQSLDKIVRIRNGELKRKSLKPRVARKPAAAETAADLKESPRDRVIRFLREHGSARPHILSVALNVSMEDLEEVLADASTFRKVTVTGQPGFALR